MDVVDVRILRTDLSADVYEQTDNRMRAERLAEAALVDARVADAGFSPDCEAEDRAGAHGRLAQVFEALGLPEEAHAQAEQAARDLQALRLQQAELVARLDAALAQVPGAR